MITNIALTPKYINCIMINVGHDKCQICDKEVKIGMIPE